MVDENKFGFGIELKWTPTEIDGQVKKLQDYINKNIKLNIPISISKELITGLEQLGKNTSGINSLNQSMQNLSNTAKDLSKQSIVVTKDANGIEKTRKEVSLLEDSYGHLLKVINQYRAGMQTSTTIENTTNLKKQKQAIDALTAAQSKMLQEISKFKSIPQLAGKVASIEKSVKGLDLSNATKTNIQGIRNEIDILKQLAREIDTVAKQQAKQQQAQEQYIKSQQQLYAGLFTQIDKQLQAQGKFLNTRFNDVLGLGNKAQSLSPESQQIINQQIDKYKLLLSEFNKKVDLGIRIPAEDIKSLENGYKEIQRLYDARKLLERDSHGFDFMKYEQFDKLSSSIKNVTQSQEYYNKSILEGWKLTKANIQETENYIKVTQQLRKGSVHKDIGIYIDKNTGQMFKFNEALRDGMQRSWGLGEAMYTAGTKAMIWSSVMGTFYGFLNVLQQIPQTIIEIDTRLTEMSKVMDNSTNFPVLMDELTQSANAYGRTITEVQDAVIEFAKAGYEGEQAVSLANTALLGANVSLMKTSEVANFVTGIMSQFNITFEEATRIIDKINEVDNQSSATFMGIAQGLLKAGETAQQFGVDINTLIGYVSAIQTATRESGNQIGGFLYLAA